ncbi:MAG: UDP-N-acetylglucosamine 2-epimerase (non-hydrolyzing), partial [Acidobacteria bacterium]|nr:UDP-N-acetylglucosamine 2-epimerase (non-hydrolyzing) [Acidobacteriota bacterium]
MITWMKVLIVVGARPNFVKVAPLFKAIREFNAVHECWGPGIRPVLVHTGQHYDEPMSGGFFAHLDLPVPEVSLSVGSGTHAEQTAEIMRRFEPVLVAEQAEALVVVGDVNSTLACALVAAKLPRPARPLIAHVEAGLRSFDRSMPEEINRTLTDSVSDLLFVTEESAIDNLRREGIDPGRVHFVGNTMIDSLLAWEPRADRSSALTRYKLQPGGYALLTLHRGANVDERENFIEILEGLQELAELCPILFPLHPRTQRRIAQLALECYFTDSKLPNHEQSSTRAYGGDIRTTGPLSYLDFIHLMKNARLVVTDSGGVQEETTALGIPCVTVRDNTERPVTTTLGTNVLAGTRRAAIRESIRGQLACPRRGRIPAG